MKSKDENERCLTHFFRCSNALSALISISFDFSTLLLEAALIRDSAGLTINKKIKNNSQRKSTTRRSNQNLVGGGERSTEDEKEAPDVGSPKSPES